MLLVSLCGVVQQANGQSDPYNPVGPGSGATGLPLGKDAHDVPPPHRADEGTGLEFKSQTTLVEVPVVVTDKSGAHIHQLTKDDLKTT